MSELIELLTTDEMADADCAAVRAGVPSLTLMEVAGRCVAEAAERILEPRSGRRVLILCGPGNDGGDGFVAARILRQRGYRVEVSLLGDLSRLKGDAKVIAERWDGGLTDVCAQTFADADLIIDALFGAGLSRALTGEAAELIELANVASAPVLAVDVPSGLDAATGLTTGPAISASHTMTFFRLKPGHLLYPGRALCGQTDLADIGIPQVVLDEIKPDTYYNVPSLWSDVLPVPRSDGHKYKRGHAVVVSGPALSTGAARLGARGALRVGADLVTVASPGDAVLVNAAHLTAIMLAKLSEQRTLDDLFQGKRFNSVLIGPGAGVTDTTKGHVLDVLRSGAAATLDADALRVFKDEPHELFLAIQELPDRPVVLTPHEGEFSRLFDADDRPKLERVRSAARQSGAVVVLKGPDTVVAAPEGRAAINANAPPWLATAGSGDVLGGFITGLLAQGMPVWQAASAGVWMHGACAAAFGAALIAEDIPEMVPQVLRELLRDNPSSTGDKRGERF